MLQNNTLNFNGFPKNFADYFFSLQFKNTGELLHNDNKNLYKSIVIEPLTALFYDLIKSVLSISKTITIKPSKCISSMYTDMRFSREKPLKDYMYLRFREPSGNHDILGFYFDMGIYNYSYGIRIYKQTSEGMEKIRNSIKKKPRVAKELKKLNNIGMIIKGNKFVKDRYPDEKNETMKELLNCKNFYIACEQPISEIVFTRKLQNEISNAYFELKELYLFFKKSLS